MKAHFPSAKRLHREPVLLLPRNGPQASIGDIQIIRETANKTWGYTHPILLTVCRDQQSELL